MTDDKPKIHAMARKLHLAADRIAERAPEDNATLLRAAADCIDVLWRIGEARAAHIEGLRARELDATAAPVVVGEDVPAGHVLIGPNVVRFGAGTFDVVKVGQAAATIAKELAAALAGD